MSLNTRLESETQAKGRNPRGDEKDRYVLANMLHAEQYAIGGRLVLQRDPDPRLDAADPSDGSGCPISDVRKPAAKAKLESRTDESDSPSDTLTGPMSAGRFVSALDERTHVPLDVAL
jgi:hypothetical protein